ncbi:MAG: DUF2188 domain-containing protein [Anaerolineae bacterium]|nr:DUF2188 domain-containing protein [Anaerolineae bacterium]
MSKKKDSIWISPRKDGGWEVQREGGKRPSRVTDTQREAIEAGREQARNDGTELIIQRKDGTIRSKDSYGPDPNPPKDKEH